LIKYQVKNIVLFPDSGHEIKKELIKKNIDKQINIFETKNMEDAIKFAYKYTTKNKICLLSCASPSYSLWKNYEEKGDLFQKFIKEQL
jgi:UDP-N-acetylmuramoylalanine--D-glutamate ligase